MIFAEQQLNNSLYNSKSLEAAKNTRAASKLEEDASKRNAMYKAWLLKKREQAPNLASFIDESIKRITHDETRAIVMYYMMTIPDNAFDYLFKNVLSIELTEQLSAFSQSTTVASAFTPKSKGHECSANGDQPLSSSSRTTLVTERAEDYSPNLDNNGHASGSDSAGSNSDRTDNEVSSEDELVPFLGENAQVPAKKVLSPEEERFRNFLTFIDKLGDDEKRIRFNLWLGYQAERSDKTNIQTLLNQTIREKIDFEKQRAFLKWYDEKQRKIFDIYLKLKKIEILPQGQVTGVGGQATRKNIEIETKKFKDELEGWLNVGGIKVGGWINNTYAPLVSQAKQYLTDKIQDRYKSKDAFLAQSGTPITKLLTIVSAKKEEIRQKFKPDTLASFHYNSSEKDLSAVYNEWLDELCLKEQQSIFATGIDDTILPIIEKVRQQEALLEAEAAKTPFIISISSATQSQLHSTTSCELNPDLESGTGQCESKVQNAQDMLSSELLVEHSSLELYTYNQEKDDKELWVRAVFVDAAKKYEFLKNYVGLKSVNSSPGQKEIYERLYRSADKEITELMEFYAQKTGKKGALCDKFTDEQAEYLDSWLKNNPKFMEEFRLKNPKAYWTVLVIGWASYASEFLYLGADFITRVQSLITLLLLAGIRMNESDKTTSNIINAILTLFTAAANLTFNPNADARTLLRKLFLHPNQNLFETLFWKEASASWQNMFLAAMFAGMGISGGLVDLLPLNVWLKPAVSKNTFSVVYPLSGSFVITSGFGYYFFYNWEGFIPNTTKGLNYWKKAWSDSAGENPIKAAEARGILVHMALSGIERAARMGFGPFIAGQGLGLSPAACYTLFTVGAFCTAWTVPALRWKPLGDFYFRDLSPEQLATGMERAKKLRQEDPRAILWKYLTDPSMFLVANFAYVGSVLLTQGLTFSGNARVGVMLLIAAILAYGVKNFFEPIIKLKIINQLAVDEKPIGTLAAVSTAVDQLSRAEGSLYVAMVVCIEMFNTSTESGRLSLTTLLSVELFLSLSLYLLQSRKTNNAIDTLGTDIVGTSSYRCLKSSIIDGTSNVLVAMRNGCGNGTAKLIGKLGTWEKGSDSGTQNVEENTIQLQNFSADNSQVRYVSMTSN
jgi:hypothetical protein